MKLKTMLLCMLLPVTTVWAQTIDHTAEQYAMRYIKEHWFMKNGEDFNVIDTDIEWPEAIGSQRPQVLQRFLVRTMLGYDSSHIDSTLQLFKDKHGQVVTGQLASLPDDKRFCYITLSAKVLSYHPGRWISYVVESEAKPEALSAVKAVKTEKYVTYNIAEQQMVNADEMIKAERIEYGNMSTSFYNTLFAPLTDEDFDNMVKLNIDGVWPDNTGETLGMHLTCVTRTRALSYTTYIPYEANKQLLAKKGRRLLTAKPVETKPEHITAPQTWRGDTVYSKVDTMPVFMNGTEGLRKYIADTPTPTQSKAGKVFVSYVVDRDGRTQDVRVVGTLTPETDRHAVNLVRGMPPYTPGKHQGRPVCVRMYVPIYYNVSPTN